MTIHIRPPTYVSPCEPDTAFIVTAYPEGDAYHAIGIEPEGGLYYVDGDAPSDAAADRVIDRLTAAGNPMLDARWSWGMQRMGGFRLSVAGERLRFIRRFPSAM